MSDPITPQRRARESAGLSLRDLERLTGINRGVLSMYERGRMLLTGEQLAKVLAAIATDEVSQPSPKLGQ